MRADAVIVAGGQGVRMQNAVSKQYLKLGGRPVLVHTLSAFEACPAIDHIYLVVPSSDFDFCRQTLLPPTGLQTAVTLVGGGSTRQESVYNGLLALKAQNRLVAIHDGVRPLVTPEMIEACIQGAQQTGACILGVPATDTLKQVNTEKFIANTLPRRTIWLAQTPQVFDYKLIREAHDAARLAGVAGTDDAALVEQSGHPVKIVMGSRMNIKITTPDDLKMAEAVLTASTHLTA